MDHFSSSCITAFGYCPDSLELSIYFCSGQGYRYEGVPRCVAQALSRSPSKGKFFSAHIRGKYPWTRLPALTHTQVA
jgi:hypothetical protein